MCANIWMNREIRIPDGYKLARFKGSPELGPKILFFSGGSALKGVSQKITAYTHNSVHIITPFDSGGSSAVLRKAFDMPAVGDIRNRLLALADKTMTGNPEIFALLGHRLPADENQEELRRTLRDMVRGKHGLVRSVPEPMQKIIRHYLEIFSENMPADFDLRGASIGNLVLTGGYLENKRNPDSIIYIFSQLVKAKGTVRPVVNRSLHLGARLEDGEIVSGQHRITGKQTPKISQQIKDIFLVRDLNSKQPVKADIREEIALEISRADLICYPMGSFFTSILANLLPSGVGRAIKNAGCPKIFIPNTFLDPECYALPPANQIDRLLEILDRDCPGSGQKTDFLDLILLNRDHSLYPGGVDREKISGLGSRILEYDLVTEQSKPGIDPERICEVLLSLC